MCVRGNGMRVHARRLARLGRRDRDGESALRIADYARVRCNRKKKREIIRRAYIHTSEDM